MRKFLLVLTLCLTAHVSYAQTATALLAKARAEHDVPTRINLLTQAIEKSPKLADAYHYRADAYRAQGDFAHALIDYTRTIELRPNDPFRYYARALLYMDKQQWTNALTDLNKAVQLKPSYKNFYLTRARVNLHLGKNEQAVSDYEKALPSPQADAFLLDMMPAYLATYRYESALKLLDKSAQEDSAALHYWRGRIYLGQNQLDEAVSALSKAINRDDSFAPAYRYRANAFKEMGDLEASLADYTALVALQPDALFYNRRGLIYEEMGQLDSAQEDYTHAISLNPKWFIPFNNRGYVRMRLKDWTGAKQDLETAISLDPTAPTPYINLAGLFWLAKKDRKQAYANLDKALKRNFKDVESLYQEDKKGWMFKGLNQTAQFRALLYK